MNNVKFVLKLYYNLFTITAVLKEGWDLAWTFNMMKVSKAGKECAFDKEIKRGKDFVFATKIAHRVDPKTVKKEKRNEFIKIHQELRHPSKDMTRKSGVMSGLKKKVSMKQCEKCGMCKRTQKIMSRESFITYKSAGGSKL